MSSTPGPASGSMSGAATQPAPTTAGLATDHESVPVHVQHMVDGNASTPLEYSVFKKVGTALDTNATVTDDGRILVNLISKTKLPELPPDYGVDLPEFATDPSPHPQVPRLHVVIQIVGSRGDVQPFIALATALKSTHGHRVRIATHATFKSFVEDSGIEFFDIGGDPMELMAYMVKNPGLIPGFESLTNGDIGRKQKMIGDILQGCLRSTYEQAPSPNTTSSPAEPFVADAIIMNPPSFAGPHIGEALGLPVHLMFTMPWTATTAFLHPLVHIGTSEGVHPSLLNYLTYGLADQLTWQALGDVINDYRDKTLGLQRLNFITGPSLVDRLRLPWSYGWSPGLVPKPKDWHSNIDVVGYWFQNAPAGYAPDPKLKAFLDAGDPPIFVGFGSVPVDDPKKMTQTIFDAVKTLGKRALISVGWGGLGGESVPDDVFLLGNVPYDWLFAKVSVVVHHGGAGTVATGLKLGRPTVIVPFFGDQAFWGAMVHESGAGPEPIPAKELTSDKLVAAVQEALKPEALAAAERLASVIQKEDGVATGVQSFDHHLPLMNMRCVLLPDLSAAWFNEKYCIDLSTAAAQILVDAGQLSYNDLVLHRSKEYLSKAHITDPVTGGGSAILNTVTDYYTGIAKSFVNPIKGVPLAIVAIPKGVASIVGRTSEGFRNLPRLYGGQVRQVEPPKNFGDGLKKGIQGLGYGYLDAVTGLVDEPKRGIESEGGVGFLKGAARGILNASFKPAAGALGVVEHPARGLINSFKKRDDSSIVAQIVASRKQQGKQAGAQHSQDRSNVLARWKTETTKERVQARQKARLEAQKSLGESIGIKFVETDDDDNASGSASRSATVPSASSASSTSPPPLPPRASTAPASTVPADQNDEDARFKRDLEMATRASLIEQ